MTPPSEGSAVTVSEAGVVVAFGIVITDDGAVTVIPAGAVTVPMVIGALKLLVDVTVIGMLAVCDVESTSADAAGGVT
jgi:hypothetical protein